jgi:acyl-coenzyme A thioesterase PaaI-like protein
VTGTQNESFRFVPDPDNPGWQLRAATNTGRFADIYGALSVRVEEGGTVRCRFTPQPAHLNILETVHGGFILAIIDQLLFVGPVVLGIADAERGITLDVTTQFFGPLVAGSPVDVVVEVLRETGRFVFVRGLFEQGGASAVAFTGKIQKARPSG